MIWAEGTCNEVTSLEREVLDCYILYGCSDTIYGDFDGRRYSNAKNYPMETF